MSEDRLEHALEAMRNESVSPEELSGARTRVWDKLGRSAVSTCDEFQPGFRDYLEGGLTGSRRLLMDDHLSRCPRCRTLLAELRGERKFLPAAVRRTFWWPQWGTWAAVAALALVGLYLTRDRIDTMLAPGGPRATVATLSGALYRVPGEALQAGAAIADHETVRTGPGARAVLRLADGSLVDVNERTEVLVRGAWSGQTIHLQRGDIIVQAAKQRRGQLRVQTRDSVASVKGTVFAVSAGLGGTLVSVVEGSVAVAQPGVDVVLKPGEQQASNAAFAHSVQDAVSWSPDAETYLALLASFAKLEKEIAKLPAPALRTQGRLVEYLPANMVVYGAFPNLGGTINQALVLAEQQAAENPVFHEWWNSDDGQDLRRLIDSIQTVTPLLGDEIVFGFATTAPGDKNEIPIVAAEVLPGKRAELARALDALRFESDRIPYSLTEKLMVASDSQAHLQWVIEHLGQGATSPFAAAIAARYERGAGWLLGLDMEPALAMMSEPDYPAELIGAQQMKHLFFEQRGLQGTEENGVTLVFKGPRMGMASWLASGGSGGAAEYVSRDAIFAFYASIREPRQMLAELIAQLAKSEFSTDLNKAETKLGVSFAGDLAAALGTESAFALEGFSVTGPAWVMAMLVNDPTTVDNSLRKLVEMFNSELGPEDQAKRITIVQETADGRNWTTLQTGMALLSVTWTYDRGYLVAASDRGAAVRAIATRSGGASLVWSSALREQLPSSAGLHPSAFVWLNTKGALQGLEALVPNATLQKLIAEKDPILVVFNGTTEQIHAASRTRLTGLILDVMMLESLSRTKGVQASILQHGRAQPGRD